MGKEISVYKLAGGDETFLALVTAFYARIEADVYLRPMFPVDLQAGKRRQFLFLTQFFGGPSRYSQERGHPRLRARHMPFAIDRKARDHWLGHMLGAIDEVGIPEPARSLMRDYFERASEFLINATNIDENSP